MHWNFSSFLAFLYPANEGTLDRAVANTSVWLSAAAYCETNTYLSRTYLGYSEGFDAKYVIEYVERDVQGYIGTMDSQQSIYVVFRGSTSVEDWIGNLHVGFKEFPLCDGCEVHDGFYDDEQSVIQFVINKTSTLKTQYPNYTIVVTGHSLGAALATFTAIDLKHAGLEPIRLFNFGSPRVGNDEFAAWASSYLTDRNRVTHYRDVVVHLPTHYRFKHISGEWFEDEDHSIHACSGYEDPDCSYQFYFTNVDDHLNYLTLPVNCDAVSNDTVSTDSSVVPKVATYRVK